jgi:glycosyltransferase involved in cell wall biosynthesis
LPVLAQAFDGLDILAFVERDSKSRGRDTFDLVPGMNLERLPAIRDGWDMYMRRLPAWAAAITRSVLRHRHEWSAALVIDSGPPSHWFFECCRRAGIPTVAYIRGSAIASIANIDRYQTGYLRMCRLAMERWYPWSGSRMASYSPVVVDNDPLAAELRRQGGDVRLIVASLVRPHHLSSHPPQASVQPQPMRICWTGRMVRLKGLHVMLEAVSMLGAAGIEFQVEFIGHGDESYIRELKSRAAQPDLYGKVRFLGPAQWGDGLFELLDRSEVFVLPSFTEGTPKTVTEAMARGLVVIASRVGGLARLVDEGETGFLVSAGDPVELFQRLRAAALDPDLRRSMAVKTLKKAAGLTMDAQLPILVTALKDAAATRSARFAESAGSYVAQDGKS